MCFLLQKLLSYKWSYSEFTRTFHILNQSINIIIVYRVPNTRPDAGVPLYVTYPSITFENCSEINLGIGSLMPR